VMNPSSIKLGRISDQIYFHGVGDVITMWNPAVLLALGDEFAIFKIYCEQEMEEALGKGKAK
jgi:MraZ protein